jgi:hypothetical protein
MNDSNPQVVSSDRPGAFPTPRLLGLVRDGNPIYVWPFEQSHVWRAPAMRLAGRVLERATRPR